MIKITIQIPDGELDIEIKKNGSEFFLIIILSKSAYFKENGRFWNAKTSDEAKVLEIANAIKGSHSKPSMPKRITINDGKIIRINLKENGSEMNLVIKEIEESTIEFQLMQKISGFVNDLIPDAALEKYTALFI